MENEVKLTKLAKCAGCGAKVGAGVLAQLLGDMKVRTDPNLLVGFDKSDDASVYKVAEDYPADALLDAVIRGHPRMQLADAAKLPAVEKDFGFPSRVQIRTFLLAHFRGKLRPDVWFIDTCLLQKLLHNALHCKEVRSFPVHPERKLHPLVRKLRKRKLLWNVYIAELVQSHIPVSVLVIHRETSEYSV